MRETWGDGVRLCKDQRVSRELRGRAKPQEGGPRRQGQGNSKEIWFSPLFPQFPRQPGARRHN